MQNHYFISTKKPLNPFLIDVNYCQKIYSIYSSDHIFSARKVDRGSLVLISAAANLISKSQAQVLDLGCGNGIISLLLAQFNDCYYDLVDINENAVAIAKLNIDLYHLQSRAKVILADGFSKCEKEYDYILFNPPIRAGKKVYYPLFEQAKNYLVPDGKLIIVIRKDLGALSALKELDKNYSTSIYEKCRGYWIISATPMPKEDNYGQQHNQEKRLF